MKILFCTNKFEEVSNGPAKFANLILGINEQYPEHEVRILTEDVTTPRPYVYKLNLKYPKALRFFSQYFRIHQYHNAAEAIRKSEFPFDVIVYNNSFIGLKSAKKFPNTVGMVNDDNYASKNWQNFKLEYPFIRKFLFKQLERASIKHHRKIITNSDYLTKHLEEAYPQCKGKTSRLYKAIEPPEAIKPFDPDLNKKNVLRILFVKADFRRGGLFTLLKACSLLPMQVNLTVIGPEKRFFNEIKTAASTFENVQLNLKGVCSQKAVFDEMVQTDIFCVPSLKEALGVANLEAISRGVPTISTNTGGIPEVLDEGKCGWLVEPGDHRGLSAAIRECLEDDQLRRGKSKKGLEFSEKFSLNTVLANFLTIIQKDSLTYYS